MSVNQLNKIISECLPVETFVREIKCINNRCAVFRHTDPGNHTAEKTTQISVTADGNYKILDLSRSEQG